MYVTSDCLYYVKRFPSYGFHNTTEPDECQDSFANYLKYKKGGCREMDRSEQGLCPFLQSQTSGHFRDCIWGHIRFQAEMYYTLCKEHR